jgi:hypothetical protein
MERVQNCCWKHLEARTRVGHRDLVDLIGVQPDLVLTALEHGGGEALLKAKRHHFIFFFKSRRRWKELLHHLFGMGQFEDEVSENTKPRTVDRGGGTRR